MNFLQLIGQSLSRDQVLSELLQVKSIVPDCSKISNSFFTQLSLTTPNGGKDMETHLDESDMTNCWRVG